MALKAIYCLEDKGTGVLKYWWNGSQWKAYSSWNGADGGSNGADARAAFDAGSYPDCIIALNMLDNA